MRGENKIQAASSTRQGGSSPHARGKLPFTCSHVNGRRLIPACAGKTRVIFAPSIARAAHPRMRGENSVTRSNWRRSWGSSPHARGKPGRVDGGDSKTLAHPRMRGENASRAVTKAVADGSSPHARGKPSPPVGSLPPGGLIPACAGKTKILVIQFLNVGAHPRMRGENIEAVGCDDVAAGSSPHARGKLLDRQ